MVRSNKPISRYKLLKIVKCFCLDLTATQTSELLGINRNTVNKYFNKFRQIIYHHQLKKLKQFKGEVELDESCFGPTRIKGRQGKCKRGRGTPLKQPVFGIYERNGQVYTEIIPDCKSQTLRKVIRHKVDISSIIYSDGWRGYDGLVDLGYQKHFRIKHHKSQFAKSKTVHINGIESFWSFTKRRLTKFNGTKRNFELHLKECEWRWHKTTDQLESELIKLLKC